MSLLEKVSIVKVYLKNLKKSICHIGAGIVIKGKESICHIERIDIIIVITLLILTITALITKMPVKKEAESKQVNLYLSASGEELFGKELMETLILEFQEKNPDIRLLFANSDTDTDIEPDILFFIEGDYSALIAANALTELNSFTNYESGARQMAIPLVSFMDMLFYNIDILTAAGFDHPPKNRDEFIAYARKVSRGNSGAAGYALSLSQNDRQAVSRDIFSWIWAAGGSFWPEEGITPTLTRAMTNDISFFGVLNREGLLAPDVFETTGEQRLDAFIKGKTAMMIASTRTIPYLRAKMGDDAFGVTTIPNPETGGKYSIGISSIYTGICANTAHTDKAWSFLAFLAKKGPLLCSTLNAVPGMVSSIIPGDYVSDDLFYSKAWDIFEASVIAEGFSGKPDAQKYETIFLEELRLFFESNISAPQTATAIRQRWNEVSGSEK
jgi:ABC-type glycerol-3-phosphate transport system substrate-binding protein